MRHVIVEYHYDPPISEVGLSAIFERLEPFLEARNVRRLRSWFADDGSRGLCEFEAGDIQTLADAYLSARVPFVRMWSGMIFEFDLPLGPERTRTAEGSYEELADP